MGARRRAVGRWLGNLPKQLVTGKSPSFSRLVAEEAGFIDRRPKQRRPSLREKASIRKAVVGRWLKDFPRRLYSRRVSTYRTLLEQEQGRRGFQNR